MKVVHLKWTIFLLCLVIGILIIIGCCYLDNCNQPIVHYLSIAATIMSIILSIFSIAFSYYSLTSSATQWSHMNAAIVEMKEANRNINNNNQALLSHVITITRNIGALQVQIPNLAAPERSFNNTKMPIQHGEQNSVRENQPKQNEVVVPEG